MAGYKDLYFEINYLHVRPYIIVPFTSSGGEKKRRSDGFEKDPEGNILYF